MVAYRVLAALAVAGASTGVFAHGMYVAPRHGMLSVVIGFSSDDEAYPTEKVSGSVSYDAMGKATPATLVRHADHVTVDPPKDTAVLVTTADYGFYARPAAGKWKQGRKSQLPGTGEGLHAVKYNVRITAPGQQGRGHDLGMEIVPLADPTVLGVGDRLPVRVLLGGRPQAGVRLTEDFLGNDSHLTAPTDKDGRTVVTLRASKLNVIGVEYDAHVTGDPDVDFYRYFTTLDFELHHVEPD